MEFLPPKGFATVCLAFGSGSHWPSTTKRYSYWPGATLRSPVHRPLPAATSGVRSGCQLLKEPATNTCLASGCTNSSTTRGGFGVSTFTATEFLAAALSIITVFFVFFVSFIVYICQLNRLLAEGKAKLVPRRRSARNTGETHGNRRFTLR